MLSIRIVTSPLLRLTSIDAFRWTRYQISTDRQDSSLVECKTCDVCAWYVRTLLYVRVCTYIAQSITSGEVVVETSNKITIIMCVVSYRIGIGKLCVMFYDKKETNVHQSWPPSYLAHIK